MNINISKVKIVVMVPRNYTDNLRELICKTKAGVIGNYTDCSVSTNVIGTFKPNDKANPTIGKKRILEKVKETKEKLNEKAMALATKVYEEAAKKSQEENKEETKNDKKDDDVIDAEFVDKK